MRKLHYLINRLARAFGMSRGYEHDHRHDNQENGSFIVYNPRWPDPPRFWFKSIEQAQKCAETLSREQPQDDFYVMKAVLVITAKPVTLELPGGSQ